MMKRLALFAAAAASLTVGVLTACGADSGGGAGPPDAGGEGATPPPPPSDGGSGDGSLPPPTPGAGKDFCDKTYKAYFDAYFACCNAQDKMQPQYGFSNALLTLFEMACRSDLEASIGKGRVTIDPGAAAACEAAFQGIIAQGLCGKTSSQLSAEIIPLQAEAAQCNAAVVGLQPAGQPCAGDYDCNTGLTCVGWTNASDGVCEVPPPLDASCGEGPTDGGTITVNLTLGTHPACAPGGYCSVRKCLAQQPDDGGCSSNGECLSGKCHVDHCGTQGPTDVDTPCRSNSDCLDTLYCQLPDGGFLGAGVCKPKNPANTPCAQGGLLQSGECKGICNVPDGGAGGTCISFCQSG
jgi:hypothetical protein